MLGLIGVFGFVCCEGACAPLSDRGVLENGGVETVLSFSRECRADDPGDLKAKDKGARLCSCGSLSLAFRAGVNVDFNNSSNLGPETPGDFGVGGADSVLLVIPDPILRIAADTIAEVLGLFEYCWWLIDGVVVPVSFVSAVVFIFSPKS
jgi:hypothetical protein